MEPAEEEENQKGRVRGGVWLKKGEWPVLLLWGMRVSGWRREQLRGKGGDCVLVCWLLSGRRKSKGRGGRPM